MNPTLFDPNRAAALADAARFLSQRLPEDISIAEQAVAEHRESLDEAARLERRAELTIGETHADLTADAKSHRKYARRCGKDGHEALVRVALMARALASIAALPPP